jgi:hypothetical protein
MAQKKFRLSKRSAEAFYAVLLAACKYIEQYKHSVMNRPDMLLAATVLYTRLMKMKSQLAGVPKPFETPKSKINLSFTFVECAAYLHLFNYIPFPTDDPLSPVVGQSFFDYCQLALVDATN